MPMKNIQSATNSHLTVSQILELHLLSTKKDFHKHCSPLLLLLSNCAEGFQIFMMNQNYPLINTSLKKIKVQSRQA